MISNNEHHFGPYKIAMHLRKIFAQARIQLLDVASRHIKKIHFCDLKSVWTILDLLLGVPVTLRPLSVNTLDVIVRSQADQISRDRPQEKFPSPKNGTYLLVDYMEEVYKTSVDACIG